jgi:hypothetical protein
MNVKLDYTEQTTDARAIATANKFNTVSVAVAHYLMMPLTNPHIAIHADGTSFKTGGALTDEIQVIYDPEEQRAWGAPLKVLPVKGSCLTAYFVKIYLCMNATGTTAPPIYICADNNMEPGVIDVHEVAGLGIGTDALGFTTLTYTPSECLNIDISGPFTDDGYVSVIVDTFTRWVELYQTLNATALSAAHSVDLALRSNFVLIIRECLLLIGTQDCLTLAYPKEENAPVERMNKEINRHLRVLTFENTSPNHSDRLKSLLFNCFLATSSIWIVASSFHRMKDQRHPSR